MTQPRGSGGGRASTLEYRAELLGRLGLSDGAGDQDIEGTYRDVLDFLDTAPHAISPWANAQRDEVDEAFALLAGSAEALSSVAEERLAVPAPQPAPRPPRRLASLRSRARPRSQRGPPPAVATCSCGSWPRCSSPPSCSASTSRARARPSPASPGRRPRRPRPPAGRSTRRRSAALMQKISANPQDVASLQSLGNHVLPGRRLQDRRRLGEQGPRDRPEEPGRPARARRSPVQPRRRRCRQEAVARRREALPEQRRGPLRPRVPLPEPKPLGHGQHEGRVAARSSTSTRSPTWPRRSRPTCPASAPSASASK